MVLSRYKPIRCQSINCDFINNTDSKNKIIVGYKLWQPSARILILSVHAFRSFVKNQIINNNVTYYLRYDTFCSNISFTTMIKGAFSVLIWKKKRTLVHISSHIVSCLPTKLYTCIYTYNIQQLTSVNAYTHVCTSTQIHTWHTYMHIPKDFIQYHTSDLTSWRTKLYKYI